MNKSGFHIAFNLSMYAAKISLMRGDIEAAISDTRLALRNANRMRCNTRKRLAFKILNWLRAARSRDIATVNAMASAYAAF